MRNKKIIWLPWFIGALVLVAFVFVLIREVPMQVEHVEEPLKVQLN